MEEFGNLYRIYNIVKFSIKLQFIFLKNTMHIIRMQILEFIVQHLYGVYPWVK